MDADFPASLPFERADFPPDAEFLDVEGAPMALLPSGLVNFFGGKARRVSMDVLKVDNHMPASFEGFSASVAATKASFRPAWSATAAS